MSLIQFAQAKDAINFKKALEESIQDKVNAVLQETKIEVAGNLMNEAGGLFDEAIKPTHTFKSAADFKAHAAKMGHHIETEYDEVGSGIAKGAGRAMHYAKDPKTGSIHGIYHTGKAYGEYHKKPMNEETLNEAGGINPKMKHVFKRPGGKLGKGKASAPKPHMPGKTNEETIDERLIEPGSVDHMAHAVHDIATSSVEPHASRGTFSVYHTPHYMIHKDHGSINPDQAEHNYYVAGAGGMHKFSVHHSSKGVDVKHHGHVG